MNSRTASAIALLAILQGCAMDRGLLTTVGPDYSVPQSRAASSWQAPLPHAGNPVELARWWQQFDDLALAKLIDAAESESATLAQAAARIEQSRANLIAAGAAEVPQIDLLAAANRASFTFGGPGLIRTQYQLGAQASWEIDLFGGGARQRQAAAATLASSSAAWHDARVSIAAEVANAYINYRYCEMQRAIAESDTASRRETAQITLAASKAGFQPPAAAALAAATAADAANGLAQRRTQCEIAVKGLVSLTGLEEPALRAELAKASGLPEPREFSIDAIPARIVAQRPDVAAAERDLAAASAQIGVTEAQHYPRLSITGNILPTRITTNNAPTTYVNTWSIGPTLTLPLIDGGRRKADVEAAQAQYNALDAVFRSRVRNAVREVEEALVRLQGAQNRLDEINSALAGFKTSVDATEVRVKAGLGSQLELLDSRRAALTAEASVAAWRQERVSAWVALYRAVGGGWEAEPSPATGP